jgi:hypothetical protein
MHQRGGCALRGFGQICLYPPSALFHRKSTRNILNLHQVCTKGRRTFLHTQDLKKTKHGLVITWLWVPAPTHKTHFGKKIFKWDYRHIAANMLWQLM